MVVVCVTALAIAGSVLAADVPFSVTSADLPAAQPIAERFMANTWGCHGGNESPELQWSNPPAGTKSFAVTLFDPHTPPSSGWWHWLVYDIPASTSGLPRNAGQAGSTVMPKGAKQLRPDGEAPEPHYYGPCPDPGDPPHQYTITVYALKVDRLSVPATSTPANLEALILDAALAKATIVHPFSRPKKGQ
jgi:hypothetical protein